MSENIDQQIQSIQAWAKSSPLDRSKLVAHFISLNRLCNWAQIPDKEQWQVAAETMEQFLAALEQELCRDETEAIWPKSESSKIFSILLTVMAEAGQYRHEQDKKADEKQRRRLLEKMGQVRKQAIGVAKTYLARPVFRPLQKDIEAEIYPLLESMDPDIAPDRFMPFRVIQVGNIAERLYSFVVRADDPYLAGQEGEPGLLREIYDRKYLRFGTSGVRGRWKRDFTEERAKQVAQAICDFLNCREVPQYLGAENLADKRIVVGYDSRLNARTVAEWTAQVCLANGFTIDLANRDTPTPALIYYATNCLDSGAGREPGEVAGSINCTASHNPPEWQGIKFNPRLGYPALTNWTDFIASRVNEIQLLGQRVATADLSQANSEQLRGFDPIDSYAQWILDSGKNDQRIPLDFERIRNFFREHKVVVDEMHGSSRGYLTRLLGEIGMRYTVIHAETDPTLPGLDYANPEEPFINALKDKVKEMGAIMGLGMDTDADRFGVVDQGGVYLRPNQILPMLVRYLGIERGYTGRVIATQTGSPLIEPLAGKIANNKANRPADNVIPAYVDHPFYRRRVGKRESRVYKYTFMVPVGIKYIEEQRRTDNAYNGIKDQSLPDNWRDVLLLGGEESSGLTTRGHVNDKDGVWANLLIMDMLAYYGTRPHKPLKSLVEIWQETCTTEGCWVSYGGREDKAAGSNGGRTDVDAVLEAKEDLINHYLDGFGEGKDNTLAGLEVVYAGGVRYDIAELQLQDANGDNRHFLRVRSSGTEPINRIYVESSHPETARLLMQTVLQKLEDLISRELRQAATEWRLVDVLTTTKFSDQLLGVVKATLAEYNWPAQEIMGKLQKVVQQPQYLEGRNRRMAEAWIEALGHA